MSVRIAVLGAGRIGQVHARAIAGHDAAVLTAIADPIAAAADAIAEQYGCDVRTIDEIAVSDDVDGVIICTPTDTHADLI
ncbi:MAG: Gfo/Idh/MocA family oxidoreductase, partial [Candidatus Puniceispirillum sp.]